jgi:hypothetical protein
MDKTVNRYFLGQTKLLQYGPLAPHTSTKKDMVHLVKEGQERNQDTGLLKSSTGVTYS